MEVAHAAGNVGKLSRIIRSTGAKKIAVSENVRSKSGEILPNRPDKLGRWAQHLQEQFNWPEATGSLGVSSIEPSWDIDLTPFSKAEVDSCIRSLSARKAAGPDELAPMVFKEFLTSSS